MIMLSEKTDARARQDLFERINTGSDELKPIEVIKGAYRGIFYDFVKECSKNKLFLKLCPISEKRALREEGPQRVLRYFAYTENLKNYKNYRGRVSQFIIAYIKSKSHKGIFNKQMKTNMKNDFDNMLNFVDKYFPYGFAKSKTAKSTPRVRFEAISIGVHFALKENPDIKPTNIVDWLESSDFKFQTRSDAANNTTKVKNRINFVKNRLLGEK